MNVDYARCLITSPTDYPETAACKATEEMLYRLNACSIKKVKGNDHAGFVEFNPTYVADFGELGPVYAIEEVIRAKQPLTIDIFKIIGTPWHLYQPIQSEWELPKEEWLWKKIQESKMQFGRYGNNSSEIMYWYLTNPDRQLRVYSNEYRGPG